MKTFTKVICLALAAVLVTVSFAGCGDKKKSSGKGNDKVADNTVTATADDNVDVDLIGTWKGSDHDGENIVHYLVFDENGYWNVYMNYTPLVRAIRQLPGQLVSFKKFCDLQNSDHTKCNYEYVEDSTFAGFSLNEDGQLVYDELDDVYFTKISDQVGTPGEDVAAQARDLFDRALIEANAK